MKEISRKVPTEQRYEFIVGVTFYDERNIKVSIFDAVSNCSVKTEISLSEDGKGEGKAVKANFEYNIKVSKEGTSYQFDIVMYSDGEECDTARLIVEGDND